MKDAEFVECMKLENGNREQDTCFQNIISFIHMHFIYLYILLAFYFFT